MNSAHFAFLLLLSILLMAVFGPILSGYTYDAIDFSNTNQPPSWDHWFGTDDLGRDLFIRVCYGARISLLVGFSAAAIDGIIGVLWGALAGYCGGWIDQCLMRIADTFYALPYLLVVILLMVIMGPGLLSILLAMTCIGWITMARIVRGVVIQLNSRDFVLGAVAIGASPSRILFRHILPNARGPILVTLMLTVPSAIFTEAFLSFMGLGVQAPMASWGTMAHEGLAPLALYPWRFLFPAVFISATILSCNLLGEKLREIFEINGER